MKRMHSLRVVFATLAAMAACSDPSAPRGPDVSLPRSDTIEARALWTSRFEYSSAADIAAIMADAKRANFNIVYLQVRGFADAMYRSTIEPCSVRLCSKLGGMPTWDPLEVAVQEAHARGIELHAWINAFTGWSSLSNNCALLVESDPGNPRHILLQYPWYKVVDSTGAMQACPNSQDAIFISPGNAGARTRLAAVAADIVRRYDVDGIHLDFIRYPGTKWSYDTASLRAFGQDPATNAAAWSQFRRDLINTAVRETHDSIGAARPEAVLSAAVWGIYRDNWGWNSSEGYGQYFQDPRAWAAGGYLDVANPMTYWATRSISCSYTDWICLLDDHLAGYPNRHVYIGMLASLGTNEMLRQIAIGRERHVKGFTIFSYGSAKSTGLFEVLANGAFRLPAKIPPMSWRQSAVLE